MITENLVQSSLQQSTNSEVNDNQCSLRFLAKKIEEKLNQMPAFRSIAREENLKKETQRRIAEKKMINKKMRTKLIKWMENLTFQTFEFSRQTLILAIKILDSYLSLTNESPTVLQLIGCASLYLASKAHEVTIVAAQCYVTASANCFTEDQLIQKEIEIFRTLNYKTNFLSLTKVYKCLKLNFQFNFIKKTSINDIESLALEIAKNHDFHNFRNLEVSSMAIAICEAKQYVPNQAQLLQQLRKLSAC